MLILSFNIHIDVDGLPRYVDQSLILYDCSIGEGV